MTLYSFDSAVPAANDNPSTDQPDMLTNNQSTLGIIGTDHITFNLNNGGQHKAITFNQDASYVPATPVNPPQMFTNTVLGLPQLFYYSGSTAQSSSQYQSGSDGSTFCLGGIIIKWGFGASSGTPTSFITPFPNNCWNVQITGTSTLYTGGFTATSLGTSSFTSTRTSGTGATGFYYLAIGN
jgi:hypothetical protein